MTAFCPSRLIEGFRQNGDVRFCRSNSLVGGTLGSEDRSKYPLIHILEQSLEAFPKRRKRRPFLSADTKSILCG
ncbi:MAG: hypothetical protein MI923_30165 [Phycisphaerales bacterium]|nr:hypothetical protein [Phycisphaerales bacterium]